MALHQEFKTDSQDVQDIDQFLYEKGHPLFNEEETNKIRPFLVQYPQHAFNLVEGMCTLRHMHMFDDMNIALLVEHAEHASILAMGMRRLDSCGLLNDENKALLIKHAQYADILVAGMVNLDVKGMLNDDNKALLVKHAQHALKLANGMIRLKKKGLLDDLIKVLQDAQYAYDLAWCIVSLQEANLLEEPFGAINKELLFQHAQFAPALSVVLTTLDQANFFAGPNGQENYLLVIRHAQYLEKIQDVLYKFEFNRRILNPKNFETLIQYREFAENFKGVKTQEDFDAVIANIKKQRYGETYFLMGSHPKVGEKNSLYKFFHHEKYDSHLTQMICKDFLPAKRELSRKI